MVVDQDDFAEAVVPEAQQDVNEHLFYRLLGDIDGAGHTNMVIRMAAVQQSRKCQSHFAAVLDGLPLDRLADLRDHKGVQAGVGVQAMVLGTADGHDHDIVLLTHLADLGARRVLDVGAGNTQAGRRARNTILFFQQLLNLFNGHIPDALLHPARRGVLKHDLGHIGGQPFALRIQIASDRFLRKSLRHNKFLHFHF